MCSESFAKCTILSVSSIEEGVINGFLGQRHISGYKSVHQHRLKSYYFCNQDL